MIKPYECARCHVPVVVSVELPPERGVICGKCAEVIAKAVHVPGSAETVMLALIEAVRSGTATGADVLNLRGMFKETRRELIEGARQKALVEAAEWRPIETAPTDGTNFLACSPASSVFLAHYANGIVDSSDWSDEDGYRERHATHWQPLPVPLEGE